MPAPARARIAVTGAGGFLGGRIAGSLAAAGLRVTAFGRTAPTGLPDGVAVTAWDGRRPPAPELRFDAVIDCAAAIPARVPDPDELVATNLALLRGAVDLAARDRGFLVYMSSQSVFGRPAVPVIDRTTAPAPDTPYGRAKLAAEELAAEAAMAGRLHGVVALRLPAVVGRGCHDNFPASAAARLARGEPVPVFNPEGLYNAVVHADTVAAFVRHLLTGPPDGHHAVSPASLPAVPLREAVAAIARGLGTACRLDVRPAPHPSPTIDPAGAAALGFVPEDPCAVLARFGREAALRIATPKGPR